MTQSKKASNRNQITPLDDPSIRSRSSKTGYFSPSLFRKLFARKPYTCSLKAERSGILIQAKRQKTPEIPTL
jgi:hypothetical protein